MRVKEDNYRLAQEQKVRGMPTLGFLRRAKPKQHSLALTLNNFVGKNRTAQ